MTGRRRQRRPTSRDGKKRRDTGRSGSSGRGPRWDAGSPDSSGKRARWEEYKEDITWEESGDLPKEPGGLWEEPSGPREEPGDRFLEHGNSHQEPRYESEEPDGNKGVSRSELPTPDDSWQSSATGRRESRVRRREYRAGRQESRASRGRSSAEGRQRRVRSGSRSVGRRRALLAIAVVVVVLVGFLAALFQPLHGSSGESVRVVIPQRMGVGEIASILDREGVVSSGFLFNLRTTLSGRRSDLKPGTYTLERGMSYGEAIDALAEGPPRNVINITVPEGLSRSKIAELAKKAGIGGDYRAASVRSSKLRPSAYGAQGRNLTLEGFLFPATYELKRGASVKKLVTKQVEAFKRNFKGVDLNYARRKNLTPYDVLTIASMVEREARISKDRPLIAAVIYNRLRNRMNLGIDATVRYAVGNWTKPLTQSELANPSPYNTRVHVGLPPGPIGNPGLDSIRAAARPARVKYLFFVVKPGTCGEHAFSSTEAEFRRDRDRYQAAREAAGKSPTNCPE